MNDIGKWPLLLFTGIYFLTAVLSGCGEAKKELPEIIPKVKVFTIDKEATGQFRKISGRVQAETTATLSFGVAGKVIEIVPVEGSVISEGQLLARLDSTPVRIKLEDARSQLNSTRAKLVEAQATYDRVQKLFGQRGAAKKDLDAAAADLATAKNNLLAVKGKLEQAEFDYSKARLTAPFSGRIEKILVDPFEEVSAGTQIMIMQGAGTLEVKVRVPENLIRFVDYGQPVQTTFPALPGVVVSGIVTSISAESEEGNAFPVVVSLQDRQTDLRSGMTASVAFNFRSYLEGQTVFLMPLSAIGIEAGYLKPGNGKQADSVEKKTAPVFVLDPKTGQIKKKQVLVGALRGNEVEVYQGLERGELVVSAGVAFLRDGMRAEAWNPDQALGR